MLIRRSDHIRPSEITDESVYRDRRRFLKAAGYAVGGLTLSALVGCDDVADLTMDVGAAPRPKPYKGLPKGLASTNEAPTGYRHATQYNNFYELGTGKSLPARNADFLVTEPWSVAVSGECAKPGVYTLEDFLKPHGLEERVYRLRCVETWSMVIPWVGFSLGDALKRFEPTGDAKYVEFRTLYDPERLPGQELDLLDWPYREGLRIDEAMNPLATLAVGMYGETLPGQNGAPLRLVLPWKYGFKSIKSIVGIRFMRTKPTTTWNELQSDEYGFYANVNPEVEHPRWSQSRERRLGEWRKRETLPFNGYAEQVAHLYAGIDLRTHY